MLLENELIRLRAIEPEDLSLLYKWENNTHLWTAGNTRNPYSLYALKQYIIQSDQDIYESRQLRLMIVSKETNDVIGTVDLFDFDVHNSRIALGLYVDDEYRGKGIARQSLKLIEQYAFCFLNVNQLYVQIAESNTASSHIFEQENYSKSCVMKQWIRHEDQFVDVILYQQFRDQFIQQKKA